MSLSLVNQKINQYLITERKGSNLYLGIDEIRKMEVAIKVMMSGDASQRKAMDAEIRIVELSQKCIFLVRYEEIIFKAGQSFAIMEYCSLGDFSKIIADHVKSNTAFTDEEIFCVIFHVGNGILALHNENIVHRDLKPENIFLTVDKIYKLGDFGISRSIDSSHGKTTMAMATIGYACPELLDGEEKVSKAMDIYSFGCIALEVIDLSHPFANERGVVQQSRVLTGKPNKPTRTLSAGVQSLRNFALQMISMDPEKRPPINALFEHPSITSFLAFHYINTLKSIGSIPPAVTAAREEIKRLQKENEELRRAAQISSSTTTSSSSSSALTSVVASLSAWNQDVDVSFLPNSKGECTFTRSTAGLQCFATAEYSWEFQSFFLDKNITQGIYRWTVRIKYPADKTSLGSFYIGGFPSNHIDEYISGIVPYTTGPCCWKFVRLAGDILESSLVGVPTNETPVPDNSTVAVEANADARTLCFFVNEKEVPHAVSDIPVPVYLGISANKDCSFTSLSFRQLPLPSSSLVSFKLHQYNANYIMSKKKKKKKIAH